MRRGCQAWLGLWQVRSSVDEEDVSHTGEEGRFIETTAALPDASSGSTAEEQSTLQKDHEEGSDTAASSSGAESGSGSKSMWQRLRGIGRKQRKVCHLLNICQYITSCNRWDPRALRTDHLSASPSILARTWRAISVVCQDESRCVWQPQL